MCDQQSLRSSFAFAQSDQSLCKSREYSMSVKLLTEFLKLKGGCTGSSESTLVVKIPDCWKSHVMAQLGWISPYHQLEDPILENSELKMS